MRDCIKGCGDKTNAASGICFSCGDGQCIVSKEQKFILEEYYKYLNPFSKYTHANFEAHKTGAKIDPNIINGSLRINL